MLAGQGYPPDTLRHPLTQYVWPHLRAGDIARNAGMAVGLRGLWSVFPLVIVLFVLIVWGLAHPGARIQRIAFRREVETHYVRS